MPSGRQIVLNEPLAERLQVSRGDRVVLRLAKVSDVAQDSTLARKSDLTRNVADLEVVDIIPAEGLGRFSLRANQGLPRNAYLSLATLQEALDQADKRQRRAVCRPGGNRRHAANTRLPRTLRGTPSRPRWKMPV